MIRDYPNSWLLSLMQIGKVIEKRVLRRCGCSFSRLLSKEPRWLDSYPAPLFDPRLYLILEFTFRIGVAMKKSSALQRCAAHDAGTECEAEVTYNKGRQAVVRMLGKFLMHCIVAQ